MKFAIASLLMVLGLAACETMEGAGQDIEKAGEALTDEAQETQSEM
ncbi:entericidin A/B family lipoprotein [Qingshengfaniella alkalisoli]|uniref:Entericidin A/B family lipoprotein n=1 Tax=Qingshengfaniella alkalisoli TaxID=2599296 RepID=A0A5B8I9L7_9RHOB|nr:entericidin A/B family lipoprotein [Qingshengfaniella alkalisoli]QDY69706.1 entericidin A/B family lipoprotein [Qingshengfaniella alkalisoli]